DALPRAFCSSNSKEVQAMSVSFVILAVNQLPVTDVPIPVPRGRPSSSENPRMPTPEDVNVSFSAQGVTALPSEATLTPLSARGPPDETTIGPARAVEEAIDQTNPTAKTLLRSI